MLREEVVFAVMMSEIVVKLAVSRTAVMVTVDERVGMAVMVIALMAEMKGTSATGEVTRNSPP